MDMSRLAGHVGDEAATESIGDDAAMALCDAIESRDGEAIMDAVRALLLAIESEGVEDKGASPPPRGPALEIMIGGKGK